MQAGGVWQTPITIAEGVEPSLAVDARGDAVAIWQGARNGHPAVQAAVKPADGPWEAPVTLSDEGLFVTSTHVAIDSQGDAVATWLQSSGSLNLDVAVKPFSGVWQSPVTLSGERVRAGSAVAMDPQGDAVAAWESVSPLGGFAGPHIIEAAVKPVDGSWQTPQAVSEVFEEGQGEGAHNPQIGADSQVMCLLSGNAWMVAKRGSRRRSSRPATPGRLPSTSPAPAPALPSLLSEPRLAPSRSGGGRGVGVDVYDPNTLPEVVVGEADLSWANFGDIGCHGQPSGQRSDRLLFEYRRRLPMAFGYHAPHCRGQTSARFRYLLSRRD